MDAATLRKRIISHLLRDLDEVQFPSVTIMNRVESELAGTDDLSDYAEVLVQKIEASRFPSLTMLDRIDALIARLEQMERRSTEAPA